MASVPAKLQTPQARVHVGLGAALLAAGAAVGSMLLVALGGTLLVWVLAERAIVSGRSHDVELRTSLTRVPEQAIVAVDVQVRHARPGQQVEVALDRGLDLEAGSNLWTPPRPGADQHSFQVRARVRGPRAVGPVRVRTWGPSRLLAAEQTSQAQCSLEVVPQAAELDSFGLRSTVLKPSQGRFNVNRPGQGFEFFTLRPYQTSDTIRDVNWKASARLEDVLIVNQRLRETHTEILILLDARIVSGVGPVGQAPLDRACRVALALYTDGVRARDTVRFYTYGDGVVDASPHWGEKVHAIEAYLARLPAAGTAPLLQAWEGARQSMRSHGPILVLSSGEADPTLAGAIAAMLGRGHPVTLFSPCPTGPTWAAEATRPRRDLRERTLQDVRSLGAIVVDWQAGQAVAAEIPPLRPGMM